MEGEIDYGQSVAPVPFDLQEGQEVAPNVTQELDGDALKEKYSVEPPNGASGHDPAKKLNIEDKASLLPKSDKGTSGHGISTEVKDTGLPSEPAATDAGGAPELPSDESLITKLRSVLEKVDLGVTTGEYHNNNY